MGQNVSFVAQLVSCVTVNFACPRWFPRGYANNFSGSQRIHLRPAADAGTGAAIADYPPKAALSQPKSAAHEGKGFPAEIECILINHGLWIPLALDMDIFSSTAGSFGAGPGPAAEPRPAPRVLDLIGLWG